MKKIMCLLLVFLCVNCLLAQQRTVSGKITDDSGKPLAGVSVMARGLTAGTITDEGGTFKLSITAANKVLIINAVGYIKQELNITNNSVYNITLKSGSENLDEVVVVGYQTVKRKEITGAISVVGAAEIAQRPIANFTQLLQGRSPGVQVIGQSGQPGQNGYIRLRGTGSINASSEPLIMVDGIAVTSTAFGLINPNDIENITVLKDASAAAIYGARAGNGVLVVTTKRGKSGKPEIKYSFQRGFGDVMPLPNVQLMNSMEKLQYEYALGFTNLILDSMITNRITNGTFPAGSTLLNITEAQRRGLWDLATSRGAGNWMDYYTQPGKTELHELSLNGASDRFRYYISLNRFNEDGLLYKSKRNRTGARVNLEYQATDRFKLGMNMAATHTREDQVRELNNAQNLWRSVFQTNSYEPVYLPNGTYNLTHQGFSPLEGTDGSPVSRDRLGLFSTIFGELKLPANITLKSQVALNYNTLKQESYLMAGSNLSRILGYNDKTDGGNQSFQYVITNTGSWNKTFGVKHAFNVLAGQEFTKNNFYGYAFGGRGMPTPSVNTIDNASAVQTATSNRNQWSIISYFTKFGYEFDKKYALTLSARRDGSSRFGANNRFANFWAAGASWNVLKERFMEKIPAFSELKVRASIGTSGNVPEDFYGSLGTYALNAAYNNLPAAVPARLPNPDLTWEKNRNWDIGFDFGLFNNRITGSFDYYNRTTSDLLFPRNVSLSTGFASILSNVGTVVNKGFEVTLGGDIIRKKDLTWNITATYTNNDNRVTQLVSDNAPSTTFTRLIVGQPLNTYYMVRWAGVNPANGKNQFIKADGSITETFSLNDQVALAGKSPLAKFFGSINSTVRYKAFDLSLLFYYTGGNYTYNVMYANAMAEGGLLSSAQSQQFTDANNYWRKAGDQAFLPSITDPTQKQSVTSDKYLQKGNYISLRDMVIGYNMPTSLFSKLKLNGVRFYIQGTNLWMGTKFKGNPEVGFSNREDAESAAPLFSQPGQLNLYAYPPARTITVGLDIRF